MGLRVDSSTPSIYGRGAQADQSTDLVQPGETRLSDVAERLGIDVNSLLQANPQIKDPNSLTPGQEVHLPPPPPPVPLRDPDQSSQPTMNKVAGPKAPVGDPVAASAMKAVLRGIAENLSQKALSS